ncbi:MAG: flagellar export chaperone FliS [bacterium]
MAMQNQAGSQAYLRTKVMTASPAELRLMLLDGAIRFCEQAKRGYETKDYELSFDGTTKAQAILTELISALRPDQEQEESRGLCERLGALYTYLYRRLVEASSSRDLALVAEVIERLRYERETWSMCLDELARENRSASGLQELPNAPRTQGGVGPDRPRVSITG